MKILVVEDNLKLAKYIAEMLTKEAYVVDQVHDGEAAERMIQGIEYDLVILDVMLPKKDGIAVCADIRTAGSLVPVLMLTAKNEVADKIIGLDSGADDYLSKPFAMEELLARVRSLLRRPTNLVPETLMVRDIELDVASRTVRRNGKPIALTLKEYAVLEYLLRHVGVVVTREQLIDSCWDFSYSAFSNITDVYIKQLRYKLGKPHEKYIRTIRGVGYLFTAE